LLEIKPGLLVEDASYEMLDGNHWVAFVVIRRPRRKERLWFALAPGYDPRRDGGAEAADQIRAYLEEEH